MALATPAKPESPYASCLSEDGDLFWPHTPHLHKVAHHSIRLLGVARPIIEDVTVGRIAPEQAGAGERPEKQRPALESVWQPNYRRGGANIADEAEDLLVLVKLLHGFCGPRRLVAVVGCHEPQLPAMDPAAFIDQIERGFDA